MAELTERLALIGELVRTAALERSGSATGGFAIAVAIAAPVPPVEPASPPVTPPPPVAQAPPAVEPPPPVASTRTPPPPAPPAPPAPEERAWPGLSDAPTLDPSRALWVGALEDEIVRSAGAPLSLLLAELEDAERVTAVELTPQARATFTRFAGAVRSAVRRQDILVCESDARAWIIARDTARGGAHALGERIAAAVRGSEPGTGRRWWPASGWPCSARTDARAAS